MSSCIIKLLKSLITLLTTISGREKGQIVSASIIHSKWWGVSVHNRETPFLWGIIRDVCKKEWWLIFSWKKDGVKTGTRQCRGRSKSMNVFGKDVVVRMIKKHLGENTNEIVWLCCVYIILSVIYTLYVNSKSQGNDQYSMLWLSISMPRPVLTIVEAQLMYK